MDYYWMMGDNHDNSQDARTLEIVFLSTMWLESPCLFGLALISTRVLKIFAGTNMFTTVGSGAPVSYPQVFLIAVAAWFVFSFFGKRRNPKPNYGPASPTYFPNVSLMAATAQAEGCF